MSGLSSGVIADIINGAHPDNPVLQILSMKRIPSGAQERYRLLVSDGKWSSSFAMLATQLNPKVASGEIANNCVIQMNRYVCNTVQENKKVLIVLDLTVERTAEEVGEKIGDPAAYDPNKKPQQQQQAPAATSSMPRPSPSGGGTPQRNPLVQRNVPNVSASPARTPTGRTVHPISSLTPYQNKWTICARITRKSDLRTWSNSRGEGKLFSVDLLDESGEIRATAFNEQVDKYMDLMEVNKIYYISMATLKTADKRYCNLNNDYEMTFNKMTEVEPCQENTDIPTMQFDFVPLDQLEALEKDSIVDVIGVCKEAMEVATLTARSTGRELRKRDLQIVDDSNCEVRLTLWGRAAEEFDGSLKPVIAIKGAKVGDFNGRTLTTAHSSTLQINPDIREAHKLKGWFDNGGNVAETKNLSGQRSGGMGGVGTNFKTFEEAKDENIGASGTEAGYFSATATIGLTRRENVMYTACPSEACNKKVIDMANGQYRCEKCNKEYDSFKYRIMLSACLQDFTDSQWVTMFQDQAEAVLGITSAELGTLKETDETAFQKVFTDAAFKRYNFRLRVKMETYNDESRLKATVAAAVPIDPKEYSRRLIEEIKQLSGQA